MQIKNLKRVNEIALEIKLLESDIENIKTSQPHITVKVLNLQKEQASAALKHLTVQNFLSWNFIEVKKDPKTMVLDYLERNLAELYSELENL
jgi:hypothetical protein